MDGAGLRLRGRRFYVARPARGAPSLAVAADGLFDDSPDKAGFLPWSAVDRVEFATGRDGLFDARTPFIVVFLSETARLRDVLSPVCQNARHANQKRLGTPVAISTQFIDARIDEIVAQMNANLAASRA